MTKTKKTPDFIGVFADLAIAFISYKQSIGFKYESETKVMSRFTKFSDNLGITEAILDKDLVLAWIEKRPNEADKSREHRYSIIRQFALYLINCGHAAYIAPAIHYRGSKHFTPHIFTHDEMARVFENADRIAPRSVSPHIHKILPVLLRMLYGCGLRISEALRLTDADVDLERGILTIKHAKFDQDRLIPMDESLTETCKTYRTSMTLLPGDFFFPARNHSQIAPLTIYNRFRDIL
jgi:integrase